ncbi:MAG TPA: hypothetical protein VHJ78_01250 [Actinomycetota bacterium]|nr:hypothetical protein [Actinomycetota bacterium]
MALDRELIRQIRALDHYDLRRLQILVQGMLVQLGEEPPAVAGEPAVPKAGKVSYRLEPVSCGKPGCSKCPHGPYWYAYWREGNRVRSRYIGRKLTADELKVKGVKPVT